MKSDYYEKLHKWPRGFKKRLCDFYNQKNKEIFNYKGHSATYRCAFCGSTNQISTHHYSEHKEKRAQYLNHETLEVDFKDFSKYIPLCRACHGIIHANQGETYSKGFSPLLQALQAYMEKIHGENGYWNRGIAKSQISQDRFREIIEKAEEVIDVEIRDRSGIFRLYGHNIEKEESFVDLMNDLNYEIVSLTLILRIDGKEIVISIYEETEAPASLICVDTKILYRLRTST